MSPNRTSSTARNPLTRCGTVDKQSPGSTPCLVPSNTWSEHALPDHVVLLRATPRGPEDCNPGPAGASAPAPIPLRVCSVGSAGQNGQHCWHLGQPPSTVTVACFAARAEENSCAGHVPRIHILDSEDSIRLPPSPLPSYQPQTSALTGRCLSGVLKNQLFWHPYRVKKPGY